jgi:hypothetical protein
MVVACPSCTKKLNVPDDAAGQTGQCPWCKSPFRLPATPPAAPATPAVAAFPAAAPTATIPATNSPTVAVLAALVPEAVPAAMAPLSLEPLVQIATGDDGTLYPLAAEQEHDPDAKRRKAQIWKEAANTAEALHRKRNPAGMSDLVWGLVFLGLMLTYVVLIGVVLQNGSPVPLLYPGILIGMAGAFALVVVAFRDNPIEGVLCLPGLPWGLAGVIFPASTPIALDFAFRLSVFFGNDLVSEILTWALIAVLGIAFPFYMVHYISKNFEGACRPLYLMLIGILYQITAFLLYVNSVR